MKSFNFSFLFVLACLLVFAMANSNSKPPATSTTCNKYGKYSVFTCDLHKKMRFMRREPEALPVAQEDDVEEVEEVEEDDEE